MRPVAQLSRAPHFGGGDEHPSRAPHFGGGDEHPAALVFSLEKEFLFQRRRRATCRAARPAPKQSSLVFRVVVTCNRPIYLCSCVQKKQRWRQASYRTCLAVASSNLPRSASRTKTKQSCCRARFGKRLVHLPAFVRARVGSRIQEVVSMTSCKQLLKRSRMMSFKHVL